MIGLFVAVTTPFDEAGAIDFEAFKRHLLFLQESGVEKIFLAGTTGEFSALTFHEKVELLKAARPVFTGEIVFNVSSTSLRESLELLKVAEEFGADTITALPPFYTANAPKEGVIRFFQKIVEASSLPLIVYEFPRHVQNCMTPEMLSEIDYVAIKDSGKNFDLIGNVKNYLGAGDSSIVESMQLGAKGIVSVQGNYRPKIIVDLYKKAIEGKSGLEELQQNVAKVSGGFRDKHQIARIKYAVSKEVDNYPIFVRVPLVDLTKEQQADMDTIVEQF